MKKQSTSTTSWGACKMKKKEKKPLHYPTLKTVLMVEDALRKTDLPIKRTELKKKLKKQMMHQTLNIVLEYLENKNMILDTHRGIIWIYNPNKRLKAYIENGMEV
jgi:hypothetical protein